MEHSLWNTSHYDSSSLFFLECRRQWCCFLQKLIIRDACPCMADEKRPPCGFSASCWKSQCSVCVIFPHFMFSLSSNLKLSQILWFSKVLLGALGSTETYINDQMVFFAVACGISVFIILRMSLKSFFSMQQERGGEVRRGHTEGWEFTPRPLFYTKV